MRAYMSRRKWKPTAYFVFFLLGAFVSLFSPQEARAQTVLLGDQIVESVLDSNPAGTAEAFQATAFTSGQVTYINIFVDATSTATQLVIGVYANSNGHPGALLTLGSTTQLASGTWNAIAVTPASVTAGTAYWLAILGTQSGMPQFRDRQVGGCTSETSSQTTLTTLPSTWTTGTAFTSCPLSAYALTAAPSGPSVILGDEAIESQTDNNLFGEAEAFQSTANGSGSVVGINLYLDSSSNAAKVYAGLYADNSGHPGALIAQGSTTQPVPGAWNQIPISSSALTAGTHYWIAILGAQSGTLQFHDRAAGGCSSETTSQTTLTALPSSWTTGFVYSACPLSAYAITAAPVLLVSPSAISMNGIQGGANPSPANPSVTNTSGGTLSFAAASDASWLTVTPANGFAPQTLQVSSTIGSLTAGTYTGHVTVTAPGVQGSPAVTTVTLTIGSPPTITTLTPTSGPAGTTVTIGGTNFGQTQGMGTVTFNGTMATTNANGWGPTSIAVTVPSAATTGNVIVTVGGVASNGAGFTVVTGPPPTITSVNPTSGPIGAILTIAGKNLGTSQGSSTVTFNGTSATPLVWGATGVVAQVPAGATTGNVVIYVSGSGLNTNGVPFTVVLTPSITSLNPTNGPVGTPVTITGTNFAATQGFSTVKFNGVAAAPATIWGPTSIQVSVPPGATTGNVLVTVSNVTSNIASFTVTSTSPTVTNLSPASGPVGTSVTIAGTNFGTSQGTVTFNGTTAPLTSWNATSIVANVPAGATTGPVLVTVNGVASNPTTFTVQTGSPSLFVSPGKINMVVGQTQAIQLLDQNGVTIGNPTWSTANPSLATIVPPVNQGDPTLLQASAIGNTTLTGTSADNRTGTAQVSILAGTSLPIGTVQWEIPSLGSSFGRITNIVQSPPSNNPAPTFYVFDSAPNGGSGAFRAFTANGQQKWMFTPSAPSNEELALLAADNQGGFLDQQDDWSDLPMLGRVDENGNQSWLISTPGFAYPPNLAIHPDGTIYFVEQDYLNTGSSPTAVVALDGTTGQVKFAIPLPTTTSTGVDYSILNDPNGGSGGDGYPAIGGTYCTPGTAVAPSAASGNFGSLTISSDGTVYIPVGPGTFFFDAMPCDSSPDPNHPGFPHLVKSTDGFYTLSSNLQVMAIHSDGTYSFRQLDSASSSGPPNNRGNGGILSRSALGAATPDGNGGTLVAVNSAFYHDTGSAVSKLNLSFNPVGNILIGENSTVYLAGPTQGSSIPATVAINTANNSVDWTYSSTGGNLSLVAATSGGGVAINNSQAGLIQLDPNGNPSSITTGYTISQTSYSWTGDWFALTSLDSGISKILLPLAIDLASTWPIPGANPSQTEAADALCDCLVETTDPAPPPPPTTCPICNLAPGTLAPNQAPSCTSTPGTLSTYLILVGDASTDPQGDHNVGNLFNLSAQSKANSLQAQGHPVVACRVSTIQQFNQALTTKGLIDGAVVFFGHAGRLQRPDLPGVFYSLVSVGQGTDDSANISYINVGTLSNAQLGPNVTITLNGCNAGKSWSPGQPPIAQLVANQSRRSVYAYPMGMYFNQNPNDAHVSGGGQSAPPNSLPMYMLPVGRAPKPTPTPFQPQ